MGEEKVRTEEYKVSADESVAKVKELIAEGNVRRVIIQTDEGKTLIEFPLTVGVAAAAGVLLLAPLLAAVGVLAAIVTDLTIVVERGIVGINSASARSPGWKPGLLVYP